MVNRIFLSIFSNPIRRYPVYIITLLLALSLIFNFNGETWSIIIYPSYHLFFLLGATLILQANPGEKYLVLNKLDISVLTLLVYQLVSRGFRVGHMIESHNLMTLALILYYLSLKNIDWKYKKVLYYYFFIASIGLALCLYSSAQLLNLTESENLNWPLTGNFSNPGPLGGFLSVIFPVIFMLTVRNYRYYKLDFRWGVLSAILIIVIIFLSESRAAILALVTTAAFCIILYFNLNPKIRKFYPLLLLPLFFIILYKGSDSIMGRLFIWKISFNIFRDHQIGGIGYDFFSIDYLKYQAAYFASGKPEIQEILLAGGAEMTFNETIKFIVENGYLGILFLLSVVIFCFKDLKEIRWNGLLAITSFGVFIAFIIFAQFSYPLYFFCFKLLLLNQISILSSLIPERNYLRISRVFFSFLILIGAGLILWKGYNIYQGVYNWKEGFMHQYEDPAKAKEKFEQASQHLRNNGRFLFNYGSFLQETDVVKSTQLMESSEALYCNNNLYEKLAHNYEVLDKNEKAEQSYLKAHYIIPVLLIPQENLMNFYLRRHNYIKCRYWAKHILSTPLKVESYKARKIRDDAKRILTDLKY